jgi:hypothetical protein
MVRRTLIQKSTPQPEMRKTPRGGTGVRLVMYFLALGLVECLASRQQKTPLSQVQPWESPTVAIARKKGILTEDSDDDQTQHRTGTRHDEVEKVKAVEVGCS